MALKEVELAGVGHLVVSRRKGIKHIRLSVNSKGQPRLSLPYYVPLSAGLVFARSKTDWLLNQMQNNRPTTLKNGGLIGKNYWLQLLMDAKNKKTRSLLKGNKLIIYNYQPALRASKKIAEQAIIRCLKLQAESILLPQLISLASQLGYKFKTAKIKTLRSRWGSCSSKGEIALSVFLVQLPEPLIEYVLIHELVHTQQMNHSQAFWQELSSNMPDYKQRRKTLKSYRPTIIIK